MPLQSLFSPLAIAPMVNWTNNHFRMLMRLIAPNCLLYTEMQSMHAVIHKPERTLFFHAQEQPLALQLGGSDPTRLAYCSKLAEEHGFCEVNLNLGCPSKKVRDGHFGACLMAEPQIVMECITAMKTSVSIPISVKTRIGINNNDDYDFFASFVHQVLAAGCDKLIIHARKAWLNGLSPKQNRSIPPLNYTFVYRIKQELPTIPVVINGNITDNITEIKYHMERVNGIMLGRLACQQPYTLATIHQYFYPAIARSKRYNILYNYIKYIMWNFAQGVNLSILLQPLFNFAYGLPIAKIWKNTLMQIKHANDLSILPGILTLMEPYD